MIELATVVKVIANRPVPIPVETLELAPPIKMFWVPEPREMKEVAALNSKVEVAPKLLSTAIVKPMAVELVVVVKLRVSRPELLPKK